MNSNKDSIVLGLIVGAIAASVFVTIVTIAGELVPSLKKLLTDAHDHHWVGKGIWAGITFAAATLPTFLVARRKPVSEHTIVFFTRILSWALILGVVALFAFFIYEYVIHH